MKRILLNALAIVLFVGASQAQSMDSSKRRPHGRGDMYAELNLTTEQKEKLKIIRDAERKEIEALKADGKTKAGKEARKTIHDKYRGQVKSVLTEEQKAKMKGSRKEGRGKSKDMSQRREKAADIAEDLNLTADQKTKMTALNQSFKNKLDGIRSNTSLTDEEKKAQQKTASEEHRKSLSALLTADQLAKMKTHRGKGPRRDRAEML